MQLHGARNGWAMCWCLRGVEFRGGQRVALSCRYGLERAAIFKGAIGGVFEPCLEATAVRSRVGFIMDQRCTRVGTA